MPRWRQFLKPQWMMLAGAIVLLGILLINLYWPQRRMLTSPGDIIQTMQDGAIQGVMDDGTQYRFHAQEALPGNIVAQTWDLRTLTAQWDVTAGAYTGLRIIAEAPKGTLYQRDQKLLLPDTLVIRTPQSRSDTDWELHTTKAEVNFVTQNLKANGPVRGISGKGSLNSAHMRLNHAAKLLQFSGRVRSTLTPAPTTMAMPPEQTQTTGNPFAFRTQSNAVIHIRAPRLLVEYAQRRATYVGGVFAQQGPLELRADSLQLHFTQTPAQFSYFEAQGNAMLASGDQVATGQWIRYDPQADALIMGDTVRVTGQDTELLGNEFVMRLSSGSGYLRTTANGRSRVRAEFLIPVDPDQK